MENSEVWLLTVKGVFIRQLFECLKEFISEASLQFTGNGITLSYINESQTRVAHLVLEADKFEEYHINKEKQIGVDIQAMSRIAKTIGPHDVLTIWIPRNSVDIHIKMANDRTETQFTTPTLDVDILEIEKPLIDEYTARVIIESTSLQKLIRDFREFDQVDSEFELSSNGSAITFFASSRMRGTRQTTLKTEPINSDADFHPSPSNRRSTSRSVLAEYREQNGSKLYCERFRGSEIIPLLKTSNLSQLCELRLSQGQPLVLRYYLGTLGIVTYCISPMESVN